MSLNYTEPNQASVVEEALEDNPSISSTTRAAMIAAFGNPVPTAPVVVGSLDVRTGVVTSPAGLGTQLVVVDINRPAGEKVNVVIPDELRTNPTWVFDTDNDIRVRFNTVERVIQSGNGSDEIEVTGDRNTTLDGAGGNDSITSSGGNDSISGGDGQDTISAGLGNDSVDGGLGNDMFIDIQGANTIDGGAGFDVVMLSAAEWTVENADGVVSFTNGETSADVTNVEIVQYAASAAELTQFSYAITNDATEADAMRLYQTALGRSADIQGAQFWLDAVESGATVKQLAADFAGSNEFETLWADVSTNEELVTQIYQNAFGEAPDTAGLEFWVDALDNGLSAGDFIAEIAMSDRAATDITNVIVVGDIV